MNLAGTVVNETTILYQPGQLVLGFNTSCTKGVIDVCSLQVTISAGNSARTSASSEAFEVGDYKL